MDMALAAVWAHPRVSGENDGEGAIRFQLSGSSPRERGKLRYAIIAKACARLIPA